jgi:hypothetical protein
MSPRGGAKAGLLVLALLASSLVLPLAASDHAYSHRYVIYGRVVDAAGNAVPGLTVELGLKDLETEGPCANQPETETDAFGRTEDHRVTNAFGEFMFCRHVHSMSRSVPGTAILLLPGAGNVSRELELDPYYRTSFVSIQLPDARPEANAEILAKNYTVLGRLWREGDAKTHVEGIRVFGETYDQGLVNVTLEIPGRDPIRVNTTTNNYGDFAVRIPVDAKPEGGFVTIEADGRTFREAVDPKVGTTAFKAELPSSGGFFSATTLYAILGIVAAAAIVAGAYVLFRRAAARREEEAIRSRSERRRANK